jgi:hypothetical protein
MRSSNISKCGIILVLICSYGTLTIAGDELPKSKLAQGRAETVLAGVDLFKTPVKQAFSKLGMPAFAQETSPESPGISGSRSYVWKAPKITLQINT